MYRITYYKNKEISLASTFKTKAEAMEYMRYLNSRGYTCLLRKVK